MTDLGDLERDEKLYRTSPQLLHDFQNSLGPLLWATSRSGRQQIRRRVRSKDTDRLVNLLNPHQDNPQLLDPYLNEFVPKLRDAFITFLKARPRKIAPPDTKLLIPVSKAICQLLYTFCKIRGEKVILQFLSTEAAHIELLLSALEKKSPDLKPDDSENEPNISTIEVPQARLDAWGWEEQYVTLLWLSLLILNPFDLDSISSDGISNTKNLPYGLTLPPDASGIPLRVIPLAIRYLVAPGKASDAAKRLLVRIAMRKDMQASGVLRALIEWAISSLQSPSSSGKEEKTEHYYLGILSFLAGILRASEDTADMVPYLSDIFDIYKSPVAGKRISTSLAQRMSIKLQRSICALVLRNSDIRDSDLIVEEIINFLLDRLVDPSTPVRLAASKALSVLASKMPPSMAEDIIEAVLGILKNDVVVKTSLETSGGLQAERYDLSSVNPAEWHGLILALSHLIYRRSPPTSMLSSIISALLLGLSFEKRSPTGASIGSNVRDAACFGIWALARRYTTEELQMVRIKSNNLTTGQDQPATIQSIATELVISGSLDPERNIRRGCSAALQELIGRHPDIIAEGITLVQTVDYHAVPLRSNATLRVALRAAQLSKPYWLGITQGLLTWRGAGDPDTATRRLSAASFGNIFWTARHESSDPWTRLPNVINELKARLQKLATRALDERHGLILCIASVVDRMKYHNPEENASSQILSVIADVVLHLLQDAETSTSRRPELTAEAFSQLINAWCHILRSQANEVPESDAIREVSSSLISLGLPPSRLETTDLFGKKHGFEITRISRSLLSQWLRRDEPEVIQAAADAAVSLIILLSKDEQQKLITELIDAVADSIKGKDKGVLTVLLVVYPIAESLQPAIVEAARSYWYRTNDTQSRIVVLQSLIQSVFVSHLDFGDLILEGLGDYTTTARGDVGSFVRIEAVKLASAMWKDRETAWSDLERAIFNELVGKVLKLGAEKMDRVRVEAQKAIGYLIQSENPSSKSVWSLPSSSKEYFSFLLNMRNWDNPIFGKYHDPWFLDMMEGYVTSADAGSEDLIRVSRAALSAYCESGAQNLQLVCEALVLVAKRNMKNDRVLVPALEIIAFLFDVQIMQRGSTNWRDLYRLVQIAHYKTGNIRKLEASVRVYGGLVQVYPEALDKLTKMLLHPIPTLRNKVADTLFVVRGVGKGIDWSRAKKEDLGKLRAEMEIPVAV